MDTKRFTQKAKYLMLALDQRTSFKKLINPQTPEQVNSQLIINLKAKIMANLANQFSGFLIDPDYGLSSYHQALRENKSLNQKPFLLCLEETGYQEKNQERITRVKYSVSQLKKWGAQGVKLLLYFNPRVKTAPAQMEIAKKALFDCRKNGLPFFLEIVTYNLENKPIAKSDLVLKSLEMFLKEKIVADVFKLEYPEKIEACQKITKMLKRIPWILLSAGVDFDLFIKRLKIVMEGGASGFLVGRALWQEGLSLPEEEQKEFFKHLLPERFEKLAQICLIK